MNMEEILKRIRDNPKTSVLGIALFALYGAGETMHQAKLEPWGSIVLGLAGLGTLVGMALAGDKPKDPP